MMTCNAIRFSGSGSSFDCISFHSKDNEQCPVCRTVLNDADIFPNYARMCTAR